MPKTLNASIFHVVYEVPFLFRVYVIGGETFLISSGKLVTSTVEMFDFNSTEWKEVKWMNEPRAYFAVAVYQELIYVFGGLSENRILHSCERSATPTKNKMISVNLMWG